MASILSLVAESLCQWLRCSSGAIPKAAHHVVSAIFLKHQCSNVSVENVCIHFMYHYSPYGMGLLGHLLPLSKWFTTTQCSHYFADFVSSLTEGRYIAPLLRRI